MRHRSAKQTLRLLVITCLFSLCYNRAYCQEDHSNTSAILVAPESIIYEYVKTVYDRDGSGNNQLFLNKSLIFNNVDLINDKAQIDTKLTAQRWKRIVSKYPHPSPYRIDLQHYQYDPHGNVVFSSAKFKGNRAGVYYGRGAYLFLSLNTDLGWKTAAFNYSFRKPSDEFDYSIYQPTESPTDTLSLLNKAFNQRDKTLFNEQFTNEKNTCLIFENQFRQRFSPSHHQINGCYASLLKNPNNRLSFNHLTFEVVDGFLAKSVSKFTLDNQQGKRVKGKAYATYVGDPLLGWKLSGLVFEVSPR